LLIHVNGLVSYFGGLVHQREKLLFYFCSLELIVLHDFLAYFINLVGERIIIIRKIGLIIFNRKVDCRIAVRA
jgi:hypothetical protein